MSRRATDNFMGALLAITLGLAGFLLLSHWAVCEQESTYCLITGEDE